MNFPKKQWTRLLGFCCVFFIAIPLIVYTLCFIPVVGYTPYKNLLDKVISGTQYMFHYHSTLARRKMPIRGIMIFLRQDMLMQEMN